MYQYLKGMLTEIHPNHIIVESYGIGYLIIVPNPYRFEKDLNNEKKIFLEQVVREDSLTLYGFNDLNEDEICQSLVEVAGIGPRSSRAILATSTAGEVVRGSENEDEQYLQSFPGTGKRMYRQVILDLKGKLDPI